MTNPLLTQQVLNHLEIPFDQIRPEHFLPAFLELRELAKHRIQVIVESREAPTFLNTVEALECASDEMDLIVGLFGALSSVNAAPEMQAVAKELQPQRAAFSNDIFLNPVLFQKLETVKNHGHGGLTGEQKRLLELYYRIFLRNGAKLSETQKQRVRDIDARMATLTELFSEKVLEDTNAYEMHLTDEKDLMGLPESAKASAREKAKAKNLDGWIFTLQAPSFLAFIKNSENRVLREKIWRASSLVGQRGSHSNAELVKELVGLRYERAQLMGYSSHADFVLDERMAKTSDRVTEFLERLRKATLPQAKQDIQALKDMSALSEFKPWDVHFYLQKYEKEKFDLDDEVLRPYFEIEKVKQGAFELARRLFGIRFENADDFPKHHPEVKSYRVVDESSGTFLGTLSTDFFPRSTKRQGAWMTTYVEQGLYLGKVRRPQVLIVGNFTAPVGNRPALLTFDEVTTLFHEFGHALHGLLSQCRYRTLSGANVAWDFVELPSQVMENWVSEKLCLDFFAQHFETGNSIPLEMVEKIREMRKSFEGYAFIRQLSFAILDMAWHSGSPSRIGDIHEFEKQVTAQARVLDMEPGQAGSLAFSHIFSGGYSAGYYSYKWAEVLDADAFELFKEKGILDRETGMAFRKWVLEKGNSEDPMSLYRSFRGREPEEGALLRRSGIQLSKENK